MANNNNEPETISPELLKAETELSKALANFEQDAENFRKTRCYSYLTLVKISADKLLAVSDERARIRDTEKTLKHIVERHLPA